jgi:hypothetical protein
MRNAAGRTCSILIPAVLCFHLFLHQSQAFKVRRCQLWRPVVHVFTARGYHLRKLLRRRHTDELLTPYQLRVSYGEEEKVPLAVIVPDPTPQLSSPAPLAAPPPLSGGGGGDGTRPRLPTERWRRRQEHGHGEARRAPAAAAPTSAASSSPGGPAAHAPAAARAPAPDSGSGGAALIKSSPAVPVPRGVTDTAAVLPMPAPGQKRQVKNATTMRQSIFTARTRPISLTVS